MKLRCIVEVLALNPDDHPVNVPLHEHQLNATDSQNAQSMGLWQSLFIYGFGDPKPLQNLLKQDAQARNLVASFNERWFVRAERAEGSYCESDVQDALQAVLMARSLSIKAACEDVLDEIHGHSPGLDHSV